MKRTCPARAGYTAGNLEAGSTLRYDAADKMTTSEVAFLLDDDAAVGGAALDAA
ncbi:hypothetical protein [Streptomyces sp. B8F3]|uniref:hypothetical protein n=1 Tax=unclassified Streptomyces TaxID=2593676 RepID=UPI00325E1DD6